MSNIQIKTKGMHCGSCEMLIVDELEEQEGIHNAQADHKTGIIKIEYDQNKIDEQKIKLIIKKEGYETE